MLNAVNHKTRPKSLNKAKKPYKKISILNIATKKYYMIANILIKKKIRIQNQSISNYKIKNPDLL